LAAREVRERETPTLPETASTWSPSLGDYTLTHFKQSKESVSQTYRKVLSVKLSVRSVSSAVWRASDWWFFCWLSKWVVETGIVTVSLVSNHHSVASHGTHHLLRRPYPIHSAMLLKLAQPLSAGLFSGRNSRSTKGQAAT